MSVSELAYLVFQVRDLSAWEAFATRVLGVRVVPHGTGLALQYDHRLLRIGLEEGPADDLVALGWQLGDEQALDAMVGGLRRADVQVTEDAECASFRGVQRLCSFRDPAGHRSELVLGPSVAETPFHSAAYPEGFVTGAQGMGHLALSARDRLQSETFYRTHLGLELTDRIVLTLGDMPIDLVFLRANARHHSLALGGPLPKALHHFMLQLRSIDDLGRAYDRASRAGVVATTLGRHPNDHMISFYATTPSGFQVELGWGGIAVDETNWQPTTHHRIQLWGHRTPPGAT